MCLDINSRNLQNYTDLPKGCIIHGGQNVYCCLVIDWHRHWSQTDNESIVTKRYNYSQGFFIKFLWIKMNSSMRYGLWLKAIIEQQYCGTVSVIVFHYILMLYRQIAEVISFDDPRIENEIWTLKNPLWLKWVSFFYGKFLGGLLTAVAKKHYFPSLSFVFFFVCSKMFLPFQSIFSLWQVWVLLSRPGSLVPRYTTGQTF